MKKGRQLPAWTILVALCLCGLCTAGCGQKEDGGPAKTDPAETWLQPGSATEYYDIQSKKESLFAGQKKSDENGFFLGMQYHQGEPVQLWSLWEEEERRVYLFRADGSRELLNGMEDTENGVWYMDEDGDFYCWNRIWGIGEEPPQYIQKLDSTGKELFRTEPGKEDLQLLDLCQLEDGSMMALVRDTQSGETELRELDPESGRLSEEPGAKLERTISSRYIAAGRQGILVLDTGSMEGISEVRPGDGSVLSALSFLGTSYSLEDSARGMEVHDFRVLEDGKMEILWAKPSGDGSVRETLTFSKTEKAVVTLRTTLLMDDGWLERQIGAFNKTNKDYYVVLEKPKAEDQSEFGTMTAVQIATGKGPDILYGYALEYVYDIAEKGGLEDLAPYMEASGVREEDYFPYAFSCWRDGEKIYTFRIAGCPSFSCYKEKFLGGRELPADIDALLDLLLDWEGNYWSYGGDLSGSLLTSFLSGDDLCGMIDWEEGSCDFSGELFAKMLKTAKKCGISYAKAMAGEFRDRLTVAKHSIDCSLYGYKTEEELEKRGLVRMCDPGVGGVHSVLAMNVNSAQKQGAWEFIRYIMREDVLKTRGNESMGVSNRAAYMATLEKELEKLNANGSGGWKTITHVLPDGRTREEKEPGYKKEEITEERIAECLAAKENAIEGTTIKSVRTEPILRIIAEEAEYFFDDVKSIDEVVDIINNRVGLYMGEHHL